MITVPKRDELQSISNDSLSIASNASFRYARLRPAGDGSLAEARLFGERVGSQAKMPGS